MNRRSAAFLILCFSFACTFAKQRDYTLFNCGVKGGFSSTFYEVNTLEVNGIPINDFTTKSEISSFYTFFLRSNIKRHYLQAEASYNISNYTLVFDSNLWMPTAQPDELSVIGTKIIGFEVPLYYGYHLLREGPYGMSLFIGPKAKFVLTNLSKHTFENFPYKTIEETIYPINFSIMVGLGVNISRFFFDFSFEYGLHNISNGLTTTDVKDIPSTKDLIFDRRKNVLSFSVGFMF